jgi:uncharacterized protein (DUF885 family)
MLSFRMVSGSKAFEGLLSKYFEELLADTPTFSVMSAGLRDGEGKLEDGSLEHVKRRDRARQKALSSLENISPRELSNEQHLDRLALRSQLLKESEAFARGRHKIEPAGPEHVLNILLHELMRGAREPVRAAANLRSLLKAAPDHLGEAARILRHPEAVWLAVMEQNVQGAGLLLHGVQQLLGATRPEPSDASALRSARKAIESYANRAHGLEPARQNSFSIGETQVRRLLKDELGLDYTIGEVESLAQSEIARVESLLDGEAGRFGRGKGAEEILEKLRGEWKPGKPLLDLYRDETTRVAGAFQRANAVTFPKGDVLEVRPVPDFLRKVIPTAAYSQPGAFEKVQRGIFWVNDLSVTKSARAEKLAEQRQHFGIAMTCAHEAYPGHHLQFVTANGNPRKWRRLFAHAVFYEGWTLWCEQMMIDLKINKEPWGRLQQLHDALWRCHRILVDLRLQTGRYSYRHAVNHMRKNLGFTRARAEADVNWYTAQPCVPMSYWLGRLENERLRARLMRGRGWKLKRFNDWLLSFGTIPQGWIEKYGLD